MQGSGLSFHPLISSSAFSQNAVISSCSVFSSLSYLSAESVISSISSLKLRSGAYKSCARVKVSLRYGMSSFVISITSSQCLGLIDCLARASTNGIISVISSISCLSSLYAYQDLRTPGSLTQSRPNISIYSVIFPISS